MIIEGKREIEGLLKRLRKRQTDIPVQIEETVRDILAEVKRKGDKALRKYNRLFDKHSLPLRYEIPASPAVRDKETISMLGLAIERIRRFHSRQMESSWTISEKGAVLGQIVTPLERVGVYVPGGKAAYPSTVLMNVIPAQTAGVKEIALCVPAFEGEINPVVVAAIQMLEVKEVYRLGGAQAVGAMAYGTETIRKVDKIVGPGNIYVAAAKRMVFGNVDIDMIAGPSEILIVADSGAPPSFVAADMLSQAEHDERASSIMITDSMETALKVKSEVMRQLRLLPKKGIAAKALKSYGAIIIVPTLEDAAHTANLIAPEHLEIMTEEPRKLLPLIKNAGAVFLGRWSPEPMGDYCAGPNHTLPTGGTARFSSPLGVYDFLKRSSLIDIAEEGFVRLAPTVERFARLEGLHAHAETIRVRQALSSQAQGVSERPPRGR